MAFLVQNITSDPLQSQSITLADGSVVSIEIYFRPMQYGWFINSLTYGDFTLNGLRITNSPDMLYQFKNILPFGLACISRSDREPSLQEDFSSGASNLYILTAEDVEAYSEFISNG